MDLERGFVGGFLVLAFVIFAMGFVMGMFAIAIIPVENDFTQLGAMLFAIGCMAGAVGVALPLLVVRVRRSQRLP